MSTLTWIERLPRRPLCDVPWLGRSVVLSDGRVNFCCYSDAVVGNVNENSLQEIWRGDAMRRIRETLIQQRFPTECQSNSCPLFRGDEFSYLLERMDGPKRAASEAGGDPNPVERRLLAASELKVAPAHARHGDLLRVTLELDFASDGGAVGGIDADVFICVTLPDATLRFLPDLADFPLPFARRVALRGERSHQSFPLFDDAIDPAMPAGDYELCAGLFLPDSNPNLAVNCLWSMRRALRIDQRRSAA